MSLKLFTKNIKGNVSDSIAIDSAKVINVYESTYTDPESNSISTAVTIYCMTGVHYQVQKLLKKLLLDLMKKINSLYYIMRCVNGTFIMDREVSS
jgi:hypothetical protein